MMGGKTISEEGSSAALEVAIRRSTEEDRLSDRRLMPTIIKCKRELQRNADPNSRKWSRPAVMIISCCVVETSLSSQVKRHQVLILTDSLLDIQPRVE